MSSETDQWFTPQDVFDCIRFQFDIGTVDFDFAADPYNAKAARYYTEDDDALTQEWEAETGWLNPPYGRIIGDFTDKAVASVEDGQVRRLILLVPARTDTKWFQRIVNSPVCDHVLFIKGRIKFESPTTDELNSAPFPSAAILLKDSPFTWDRQPKVSFKALTDSL